MVFKLSLIFLTGSICQKYSLSSDRDGAGSDLLEPSQINEVADYVVSFGNMTADREMVEPGKAVFAENCAACHGESAEGLSGFGAPRLSDGIWLKRSAEAEIAAQIRGLKNVVMPAWVGRLGEPMINKFSVFVHTLGGGH